MSSLFDDGYYKLIKWGMIFCGSWPGLGKFQARTIQIILVSCIISVMIPEVKSALYQITNDWKILNEKSSDQIMHVHGVIARKKILLYFCFLFIAMIIFFGCSLMPGILDIIIPQNESRDKVAPFETDYSVNFDDYFYTIILHGVLGGIAGASYIWTADAFVIIMVQHCCALFETTSFILKKLNNDKNYSNKYEMKIILFAITIHKRAIAFADFIEESVSTMYGVVIFVNMIMISIAGVNAILRLDQPSEAMRMGIFSIAATIHLFFNSLPSQQLIDESSRLSDLIYDCNWPSLTIKSQKLILLMLVRSIRPCFLTAGKIYQLNMENFSQVMKTAMSYLTVLSSFR